MRRVAEWSGPVMLAVLTWATGGWVALAVMAVFVWSLWALERPGWDGVVARGIWFLAGILRRGLAELASRSARSPGGRLRRSGGSR